MKENILQRFAEAWDGKNIDKIASLLANDCAYKASVGPEPGRTYEGKSSVLDGIREMFSQDSGGKASVENIREYEDFGVYEWTYAFKDKSIIYGCDLFELRGGKIKVISAFRKTT